MWPNPRFPADLSRLLKKFLMEIFIFGHCYILRLMRVIRQNFLQEDVNTALMGSTSNPILMYGNV